MSFGKRNSGIGAAPPARSSTPVAGSPAAPSLAAPRFGAPPAAAALQQQRREAHAERAHEAEKERFAETASKLRLGGEIVGFIGLLIAALATILWPSDPASVAALYDKIFVPGVLTSALDFEYPRYAKLAVGEAYKTFAASNYVVPAIMVTGFTAISRRRWVLASLCAAFFAFPWSALGYQFTEASTFLFIFCVLFLIRFYHRGAAGLMRMLPMIAILGPAGFGFGGALLGSVMNGSAGPTVAYSTIQMADLKAQESKPKTWMDGEPRNIVDTLAGLKVNTPQQIAAKSYVMAQELALRGKPAEAMAALQEAKANGFKASSIDQQRIKAIRDNAAYAGILGDAARANVVDTYQSWHRIAWAVLVVGILLGVMGPLADVLTGGMFKRLDRIRAARAQLAAANAANGNANVANGFGRADDQKTVKSISAIEGDAVVEAISRRVTIYLVSAAGLLTVAVLAALFYQRFGLPPTGENTAFDLVALAGGLSTAMGVADARSFATGPYFLVPGIILVYFIYAKARALMPYALAILLAGTVWPQIRSSEFFRDDAPQIAVSAFKPELRKQLQQIVATNAQLTLESPKPIEGGGPLGLTLAQMPPANISGAVAAYTLAQIAYLGNRPTEAGAYLQQLSPSKDLVPHEHRRRIELMHDWVAAHGVPAERQAWQISNVSGQRNITALAFWLSLAAAGLGLGVLALAYIANGRRSRIEDLVEQRRRSEFMTGASF